MMPRVSRPRRASSRKHGGEGAVVQRQRIGVRHFPGVQIRQLHLGRGDEVEALGGVEEVLLELRQLARARERGGVGERRHPPLLVAAGGVLIQHEGDERALETGAGAAEHVEAALGQLHAALEIDDVQGRPQIPMGLRLEALGGEIAGRAPAAHLGIVVLVLAHRRGGVHHIRNGEHERVHGGLGLGAGIAQGGELLVDLADGLLGGVGLVGLALAPGAPISFESLLRSACKASSSAMTSRRCTSRAVNCSGSKEAWRFFIVSATSSRCSRTYSMSNMGRLTFTMIGCLRRRQSGGFQCGPVWHRR